MLVLREAFELLNEVYLQADANKNMTETAGALPFRLMLKNQKTYPCARERDLFESSHTITGISTKRAKIRRI